MYSKFRKIIDERGITSYRVSAETGVLQSTLSAWKNNHSNPRTDTLKKIADYLGVKVDDLI